jgi:TfoX/Sxy family transcriptional regulator of competence genes
MSEPALADRVRQALAEHAPREVSMFGGLSFMVRGALAVAARGNGELLVRVRLDQRDALLERGAVPAAMNANRRMGPEWLSVPAELVATPEDLDFWLGAALARALTA